MFPFVPSLPNEIHHQSGNNQSLQQGMQFNPDQQNQAAFNRQPRVPIQLHGQNPRFTASPMPTSNNQLNPMPGLCFPNGPNAPSMNNVGALLPQGQIGQQFPLDNVNQMMVLQLLQQQQQNNLVQQQQQQQNNLVQLLQNNFGQLQNNNIAALLQACSMPGTSNLPPNLSPLAAMLGQLYSQNPILTGNQVLPSQFPQQQEQLLSSMQTVNFPPTIQPGGVGTAQMVLSNLNSNFGNAMLPNNMQCKNQALHPINATTTTGHQQLMSSMQTVNIPPRQMVMANCSSNFGNGMVQNEAMQHKNQNPHLFNAFNITGQRQLVGSMQTLDAPPSQMVLANSNLNSGNAMLQNKAMQHKNQSPHPFAAPTSTSSMQTLDAPPSQMVLANSNLNSGNGMLQNKAMQHKNQSPHPFAAPTSTGQQQPVSSMQTVSHPPAQIFLARPNSTFGNAMLLDGATQWKNQNTNQFTAPAAKGQRTIQEPTTSMQQPIIPFPMIMQQTLMNMQPNGHRQPQMNYVANGGQCISGAISGHDASKKFTRNFQGFQNSRFHQMKNAKSNTGCANNGRKGQPAQSRKGEKDQLPGYTKQPQTEQRRPIHFKYTESEVRRWCEARKRNFPTKEKTKEKLARMLESGGSRRKRIDTDEDAKLRRMQLREVLAKQKELGVPVAEIPASFLAEPKNPSKKIKLGDETPAAPADTAEIKEPVRVQKLLSADIKSTAEIREPARVQKLLSADIKSTAEIREPARVQKLPSADIKSTAEIREPARVQKLLSADIKNTAEIREPALVQKLPSADIKTDRNMLLQTFRFMALNSFFEQWPEKPVEFPVVTIEDGGCDSKGNLPPNEMVTAALGVGRDKMDEEVSGDDTDETDEEGSEDETDEESSDHGDDETDEESIKDGDDETDEVASEDGYSDKQRAGNNLMGEYHVIEQSEKPEVGEIID